MSLGHVISLLVAFTLIEMSFATGLGIRLADVVGAMRDRRQLLRAGLANYVAVPAAAVLLILMVDADPLAVTGILILAVCPGAPYGPPFTALARGTTASSVGLMVMLAGSAVVMAPLLLSLLLPLTTGGSNLHVDPLSLIGVILGTQLLPLFCGLTVNHRRPELATRWLGPAIAISKVLNAATFVLILTSQYARLLDIRPRGIIGMLILLGVSVVAGWVAGGPSTDDRKAIALTTSIRNVGLGLAITTSVFPDTSAANAVIVYGLMQLLAGFLLALWWRRTPLPKRVRSEGRSRAQ